jgi:hypothetical protein
MHLHQTTSRTVSSIDIASPSLGAGLLAAAI